MTTRSGVALPRAIYEEDLQARLDAAMARTRRFITSTEAVRARADSQHSTSFTPYCSNCQQAGRTHDSAPTREHYYICVHCHRRWATPPSVLNETG
jgi:hypothetical protein